MLRNLRKEKLDKIVPVRLSRTYLQILDLLKGNEYEIPGLGKIKVKNNRSDVIRFCIFYTFWIMLKELEKLKKELK